MGSVPRAPGRGAGDGIAAAHADTPIILVEDRRNTNSWILPARDKHHTDNHAALKAAYKKLVAEGVKGLSYIDGDHLYGDDTEGATDASHASDLGFMRQSDVMEPVLRKALGLPVKVEPQVRRRVLIQAPKTK